MRKGTKKLELSKETILRLEEVVPVGVGGGVPNPTFATGCCLTFTCATACQCSHSTELT
jgi:hypothetical protein